jgi:hypothetical protein
MEGALYDPKAVSNIIFAKSKINALINIGVDVNDSSARIPVDTPVVSEDVSVPLRT